MGPATPPSALETAAIRVQQTTKEKVRTLRDQLQLPWKEDNPALVLLARAMLWEEARPALRVGVHLPPRPIVHAIHPAARNDGLHRILALARDLGIARVERDAKLEHAPSVG